MIFRPTCTAWRLIWTQSRRVPTRKYVILILPGKKDNICHKGDIPTKIKWQGRGTLNFCTRCLSRPAVLHQKHVQFLQADTKRTDMLQTVQDMKADAASVGVSACRLGKRKTIFSCSLIAVN